MNPVITFENVCKRYGARTVFRNLSFAIEAEEIIGIVGPSGSGKTTLIKLIAGMERATRGRVTVPTQNIGYVFQEPRLLPWETALGNVMLPLLARGMKKKHAKDCGRHFIELAGLGDFADHYPAALSGGMMQRVSLARAFAVAPEILLFDEAFNGLDPHLKTRMTAIVTEMIRHRPTTVLFVTHCLEEIESLTRRVFHLSGHGDLIVDSPSKKPSGCLSSPR